ncbi:hypothetical protein ACYULU_04750 [Breznakiellaceae bacterium SP9]
MKRIVSLLTLSLVLCAGIFAQEANADTDTGEGGGSSPFGLGGLFGAVTVDGKKYAVLGLQPALQFGKLGIKLDINLLFDEDSKIRREDWDNWEDYVDKIYYVSWAKEHEKPFFFKFGGIDSATLGLGILINNYSNTLEYPSNKRIGLDIGFETDYFGAQVIVSNFWDLQPKNGLKRGGMMGGRAFVKPISSVQLGFSAAVDLNEYRGLKDSDGDGYPDRIDDYPQDKDWHSEYEYYEQELLDAGYTVTPSVTGTKPFGWETSRSLFYAADADWTFFEIPDALKLDLYGQVAQSHETKGWGFTAPGVKVTLGGGSLAFYADYRQRSDEFIFSYYNDTYDLQRAVFKDDKDAGRLRVVTKSDTLKDATELRGYFAGLQLNIFDVLLGTAEYQDMAWGSDQKDRSVRGILQLNNLFGPIATAKAFYVQNDMTKWEVISPSTIWGAVLSLQIAGTTLVDFKYTVNYEDLDGDGRIQSNREAVSSMGILTTLKFF